MSSINQKPEPMKLLLESYTGLSTKEYENYPLGIKFPEKGEAVKDHYWWESFGMEREALILLDDEHREK